MIYNFKTDEGRWAIDDERLTWARVSSILATPSVIAAENNIARFVAEEEGLLAPVRGGSFILVGRKPTDKKGQPQLSMVSIVWKPIRDPDNANKMTMVTLFQANVPTSDLQTEKIEAYYAQCLLPPGRPAPPQTQMPPITKAERETQLQETPQIQP